METSTRRRLSNLWLPYGLALRAGTLDLFSHRERRRRFLAVLFQHAIDEIFRDPIPIGEIEDLAPFATTDLSLTHIERRDGTTTVFELCCLAAIAKGLRAARRIFEIGTFTGNTTLQLAANTPASCEIVTLDRAPRLNPILLEPPYRDRVRSITADSTRFDFGPFLGSCDLVFVDGSHEYADVKNDTSAARDLVRPGGTIAWHDYSFWWDGVVRHLRELSREISLVRIRGTSLVVHQDGRGRR